MSTEPTPLSVEQPYSRDELVHLAENMRHSTVQQIVGATEQKTINRLLATIDAKDTEIAVLKGALEHWVCRSHRAGEQGEHQVGNPDCDYARRALGQI